MAQTPIWRTETRRRDRKEARARARSEGKELQRTGKGSERWNGITAHGPVFRASDRCTGNGFGTKEHHVGIFGTKEHRAGKALGRGNSARTGVRNGRVRTSQGLTRGNGARGRAGLDWCASIAFALDMQAWYPSLGVG